MTVGVKKMNIEWLETSSYPPPSSSQVCWLSEKISSFKENFVLQGETIEILTNPVNRHNIVIFR